MRLREFGPSWAGWRAVLKAAFPAPLTEVHRELFQTVAHAALPAAMPSPRLRPPTPWTRPRRLWRGFSGSTRLPSCRAPRGILSSPVARRIQLMLPSPPKDGRGAPVRARVRAGERHLRQPRPEPSCPRPSRLGEGRSRPRRIGWRHHRIRPRCREARPRSRPSLPAERMRGTVRPARNHLRVRVSFDGSRRSRPQFLRRLDPATLEQPVATLSRCDGSEPGGLWFAPARQQREQGSPADGQPGVRNDHHRTLIEPRNSKAGRCCPKRCPDQSSSPMRGGLEPSKRLKTLAPRAGLEPATIRLTVECSTS